MSFLLLVILIVLILIGIYLNHIRQTPHGRIELKSALALKLIKEYRGDDIFEVRSSFEKLARNYSQKLPLHTVKNFTMTAQNKDVPVRFYSHSSEELLPLIVFIHGGGWCIGSLDTHDQQCRRLAISTGFPVLSIGYSLSPEVKFPTALHEVVEIISSIVQGKTDLPIATNKLAIVGDSAGGNIAISSALLLAENDQLDGVKCIVPVYPVTDCSHNKLGSYEQFSEGLILTKHLMDLFSHHYIPVGADLRHPYLSPIYSDKLNQLPPCFVLTAGFDPLRDEGEAFADKLKSMGHDVKLKRYDNVLHSFFGQQEFGQKGLTAVEDVAHYLKKYLK